MSSQSPSKTVEKIYQKKSQIEHCLLRPDTYIGSVDHIQKEMWVYDEAKERIVNKTISYVPGLYKIFDEILVNAADNFHRDKKMSQIKVTIDSAKGLIKVWNNGKGIPVVMHKVEKAWVPELIFGHLLTSSNYNDDVKKVTGGRNGLGAKLTNIFSKKFTVTCADTKARKKYTQVFRNNLSVKGEPKIEDFSPDSYDFTEIAFEPDLKRFGMAGTGLDKDIVALMTKRVYDLAGVTPASVNVYLNGKKITNVKNFQSYIDLYFDKNEVQNKTILKVYEAPGARWEVCASLSTSFQFQQVSFVNSINTSRGGTHVELVAGQICDRVLEAIQKKHKKIEVKRPQVKSNLWLFVNCMIENPAFDSQTKETLTTRVQNFGSKCQLSDTFLKNIVKSPIVESVVASVQAREAAQLKRALGTGGKKKKRLLGIPKLEDANLAGTGQGYQCTLILTEGDSAKALAMSGLQIVGRDRYGVFPLKGKLLNVRDVGTNVILKNDEVQHLIKIIGLFMGKEYNDVRDLRYGSVMFMTDQDHDGSHIKGLLINFFHHFWPSLLKKPGFLKEFVTPIVKVSQGSHVQSFYTMTDYEAWEKSRHGRLSGWKIKYYKGLGTSTAAEAKEYFKAIDKHMINFRHTGNEKSETGAIELAFAKSMADARKDWLSQYNKELVIDHSKKHIGFREFVDQELIHFSIADNHRSIPSVIDGLKPGQRKILFSCFKRLPASAKKFRMEIKVAQLSGYVGEHSAYHHGEMSLNMTIVGMAQDFVGANNVNLLMPVGQFGTRMHGGKDYASARYIFTNLNEQTRYLFPEEDQPLMKYIKEEGMSIEPDYYVPVIPLVLANGAEGIGTGWSTCIPQFSPIDLVDNLRHRLKNKQAQFRRMMPWYRGFNGDIELQPGGYLFAGKFRVNLPDKLEIFELPLRKWTRDYKNFLEELAQKDEIEDIQEFHKDNTVKFVLTVPNLKKIIDGEGILKKFKLTSTFSSNNYVLFDKNHRIKKYDNEVSILEEFYPVRYEMYIKRKKHVLNELQKQYEVLSNKCKFITGVNDGSIPIRNASRQQIVEFLVAKGFKSSTPSDGEEQGKFEYLLSMPIYSLTKEKVLELQAKMTEKKVQIDELQAMSIEDLWLKDLDKFEAAYRKDIGMPEKKPERHQTRNTHSPSKTHEKVDEDWQSWDISLDEQKTNKQRKQPAVAKKETPVKAENQVENGQQSASHRKVTLVKVTEKVVAESSSSWSSSSEEVVVSRATKSRARKLSSSSSFSSLGKRATPPREKTPEKKPSPSKLRDVKLAEKIAKKQENMPDEVFIDLPAEEVDTDQKNDNKVEGLLNFFKPVEKKEDQVLSLRERLGIQQEKQIVDTSTPPIDADFMKDVARVQSHIIRGLDKLQANDQKKVVETTPAKEINTADRESSSDEEIIKRRNILRALEESD